MTDPRSPRVLGLGPTVGTRIGQRDNSRRGWAAVAAGRARPPQSRASTETADALRALLGPELAAHGIDLEDVRVSLAGSRRLVRLVVDADGGVSLDAVAEVSRDVSALLDDDPRADAALGGAPYVLEVSSPGVDRPLTTPRHWQRARGHRVAVTRTDGTAVTGRLLAADDGAARLATESGEVVVRYPSVGRAVVEVEFNRADEPGADDLGADDPGADDLGADEPGADEDGG